MLMKEGFNPRTVGHKNDATIRLAKIGRLNLYTKHSTKCETVAKIQRTVHGWVAKLWSDDSV